MNADPISTPSTSTLTKFPEWGLSHHFFFDEKEHIVAALHSFLIALS